MPADKTDRARRRRVGGFSLVELLIVIAVIVILIALLLPAIGMARATARQKQCASNLVQVYQTWAKANSQGSRINMQGPQWTQRVGSYVGGAADILYCPDDVPRSPSSSYGLNSRAWKFGAQDAARVVFLDYQQPEAKIVGTPLAQLETDWPALYAARHFQQLNVMFTDGHVGSFEPRKIDPRRCDYYERYWRPYADSNIQLTGCSNSGDPTEVIPQQSSPTATTTGATSSSPPATSSTTTTTTGGSSTGPPPPPPTPNLVMSITDSVDPVQAGAQVTYTITVTNNGAAAATGVTVSYAIPAGTTHVTSAANPGNAAFAGGTVTGNLGDLAIGGTATVTVTVSVPTSASGQLSSTATVASGPSDTETTDVDPPPPGCDPPRNAVCTAANSPVVSSGNLYAWYKFDDPGDWGKDSSGRGNHAVLSNCTGMTDDPERCNVLNLGIEQLEQGMFIPIATLQGSTDFTLAFWYKQVKSPCQLGSRALHGLRWSNNPSHADMNLLRIAVNQGGMAFNYHHCNGDLGSSQGWATDSTWSHFALAFTTISSPYGGNVKAYKNGALTRDTGWMFYFCGGSHCPQCYVWEGTNFAQGENSLVFGTDLSGKSVIAPGTGMSGRFDDIRIYRGQLSAGDIAALFQQGQ